MAALTAKQIVVLNDLPKNEPSFKKGQLAASGGDIKLGDAINGLDQSHKLKTLKFRYSFATDGGAQGVYILNDENGATQNLPAKTVVERVVFEALVTTVGSGGAADISLGYTDSDVGFGFSAVASTDGSFVLGTVTIPAITPVKFTTSQNVIVTIATKNLSAGKFNVYVEYYEGS
jgi:hypothetical protein